MCSVQKPVVEDRGDRYLLDVGSASPLIQTQITTHTRFPIRDESFPTPTREPGFHTGFRRLDTRQEEVGDALWRTAIRAWVPPLLDRTAGILAGFALAFPCRCLPESLYNPFVPRSVLSL